MPEKEEFFFYVVKKFAAHCNNFFPSHSFSDDTYMYDDAIATSNYRNIHPHHQHWYDEPPYESDPDDFLMSGIGPAATIQVKLINSCKRTQTHKKYII